MMSEYPRPFDVTVTAMGDDTLSSDHPYFNGAARSGLFETGTVYRMVGEIIDEKGYRIDELYILERKTDA